MARFYQHFLLTFFLLLVLGTAVSSTPVDAQEAATLPPDPRFGATEAFWAPEDAADLGIGWERILFYWRELQPTGPDDWNTLHVLEEWLDAANAEGRTVVGLLKNTPLWATDDTTEAGVPRGLYLPIDDPDNLWAGFLRRTAQYYSVRGVHHWIIWNEPEIDEGVFGYEFAGSTEDYYQLLKVAYLVLKEEDPEAVIHLAGITWWHDPGFLDEFFGVVTADPEAAENNYYFDIISLHIYFRAETMATIIDAVEAIQERRGLDKPIWVNEMNAAPNRDPLWPTARPQFQLDLEQQAWFIIQGTALGFASGAENISVYKLMDVLLPEGGEPFGLMRPDFSRRPAFEAYQTTIDYLDHFRGAPNLQRTADFYVITFFRPEGITRVLWARNSAVVTLDLPALAESGLLVGVTGETQEIRPVNDVYNLVLEGARCFGECLVGGRPIILFEEGAGLDNSPLPLAVQVGEAVAVPTLAFDATITATPTSEPTLTPTSTPTLTPSPTYTPEPTATSTETPLPTLTATATETAVPTLTPTIVTTVVETPAKGNEDLSRSVGLILILVGIGLGLVMGWFVFLRLRSG